VLPDQVNELVDLMSQGRRAEAEALHQHLNALMEACFLQTNPLPIKTMQAVRGNCDEVFRLPMTPMDSEPRAELLRIMRRYDLLPE